MNAPPGKDIIEEVALVKGINPSFVEKDWYVTQVIKIISEISYHNFQIVFTGGTALSKAHKLLQRFSEDIDFRIVAFQLTNEHKSAQWKILSKFKNAVTQILQQNFHINTNKTFARNENRFVSFEIDYPTRYLPEQALRPHILIEFTVTDLALPAVRLPVSSLINEVLIKLPEVTTIGCTDITENTCEKLSAITWRIPDRVRGGKNDDPSIVRHIHDLAIVRHIHDLAILGELAIRHAAFKELAIKTVLHDDRRSLKIAGLSIDKKFATMLNILDEDKGYIQEYDRFVQGMSYATDTQLPSFPEAMEKLRKLVATVIK